jgi:hypothetical protein
MAPPTRRPLALVLTLLVTLLSCSARASVHLLDAETSAGLSDAERADMQKREVENCVPYNVRSFVLGGARAVVEWSTRRTYIRKVSLTKKSDRNQALASPWQSCRDVDEAEVRYRRVGAFGQPFASEKARTFTSDEASWTTHTAFVDLDPALGVDVEFMVGSVFHGWSALHRLGANVIYADPEAEKCRPKHVHTAYGAHPSSFSIQWTTTEPCADGPAIVKLAKGYRVDMNASTPLEATVLANTTHFTDSGPKRTQRWMHLATLDGLDTHTRYTYMVGNPAYKSWSIPFSIRTAPSQAQTEAALPMRFLVTGDIGYQNAATLPMMQSEVAEGAVDAVVSMGDYAYDLHLADGHVGDIFMQEIEPIAATVPFMVCPGNHEMHDVFSHYTERFRLMPSNTGVVHSANGEAPNNWFFSYDVGLVHFTVISTEIYFKKTLAEDGDLIARQEAWLKRDLEQANANRAQTPWLIVMGHRPMYCTSDADNCGKKAAFLRARLEDLFYEQGVDLYICGHQHNYERAFDVYKGETWQRTRNMRATTHILTGASGQYILSVMRKEFELPAAKWDAFRNSIFGYSRLQVHNATHVRWQQVEADPENPAAQGLYGKVVDDVWLVQEQHGSFAPVRA